MIPWPYGARRVRHLRGPMPAGKWRAGAVPASRANRERTHESPQPFHKARVSFNSYPICVIFKASRALALITIPSPHFSSERSAFLFPLTLGSTHIIILLLKTILAEFSTDAEVFLTLLIKLFSGETRLVRPGQGG